MFDDLRFWEYIICKASRLKGGLIGIVYLALLWLMLVLLTPAFG